MVRGRVSEEHLLLRGCCPWHRGSVLPVLRFPAFPLKPAGLPCALCHYISQSGLCRKEAPSKWLLAPWKILDSPKFCLWRFIITATEQISTGAWFFCYSFKKHKWFPAAGAAMEKHQPVSVICQWTFPSHAGWGFQSDCERPQFCLWAYMTKMYFLTYITSHFQTLKKAAYEPGWCFRLFTAQQACNNLLRKYDPDRREKNPTLLSCIEIHTDIGWKLLLCSNI